MQRGYRRAIRRTPVFNDEAYENPTQIDLTCDSDLDELLQEAPPQEVLQKSEFVDEQAEMEAQLEDEENAMSSLRDEGLLDC